MTYPLTKLRMIAFAIAAASVPTASSAQAPKPEVADPPAATPRDESLSDQLSRDKGVIKPPDVERSGAMEKQPPETGAKTPVLPPPGTEGRSKEPEPK